MNLRRTLLVGVVGALLALGSASAASAHVHAINPLLCLDTDHASTSGGFEAAGHVGPTPAGELFAGVIPVNASGGAVRSHGAEAAPCTQD